MQRLKNLFFVKVAFLLLLLVNACTDNSNQANDQADTTSTADAALVRFETERLDLMAADVASLIEEQPEYIILDIRTPEEYTEGHIANALNINFYADDFKAQLAALDREQTYIVHCRSGGRSGKAVPMMEELGFRKVIHLAGGIKDWEASSLPVFKD